ncbi:hypothetical protein [Nocardioides sp. Soil805]|uniref:hypothetical protein n=1 Tax=Nocardioides sp. Soil805 TaxID=1736416 RepID=UPI0007027777|nr:hypothetical protein [Nocardioides sp. Soil805]KRF32292.1 hypothetical protein ASG94_17590 [Nocardioides sp. Soil805]
MLILLAIPVIVAVALAHRSVQAVAPSNLLVRRVRSAQPRWRTGALLLGLAMVLLLTMHIVANAASAGFPGWLNLVVLVLAWDALKVGWLAVEVIARGIICVAGESVKPRSSPVRPALTHGSPGNPHAVDGNA